MLSLCSRKISKIIIVVSGSKISRIYISSANPLPSHSNFNSQDEGAFCSTKLVDRFVVRCISTPFLIFLWVRFRARTAYSTFHFCNQRAAARVEVVCACDLSRARCNVDRDVLFSHKANQFYVYPARIHGLLIKTIRSDIGRRRARGNSNFARTCRASAFSSVTALFPASRAIDPGFVSLIYIIFRRFEWSFKCFLFFLFS